MKTIKAEQVKSERQLKRWLAQNHPQFVYTNISKNDKVRMGFKHRFVTHHQFDAPAIKSIDFDELNRSLECMTYDDGHIEKLMMDAFSNREDMKAQVIKELVNDDATYKTVDMTRDILKHTKFIKDVQNYFQRDDIEMLARMVWTKQHPDILEQIRPALEARYDDFWPMDDMLEFFLDMDNQQRAVYIRLVKNRQAEKEA